MSPKVSSKAAAKPSKKAAAPKAAAAPAKKAGKAAAPAPEAVSAEPAVDPDELEEQEDSAAAASSGQNSNAAALAAAASGSTESASFKNFRHHPDMENFYRFIYENDLRHEALDIIDAMQLDKMQRKQLKTAKASAH